MHIYFSGIGGVAIGPLSEIALDAGHTVSGSDMSESLMIRQLVERGVDISIGQDDSHIARLHETSPIDWFVHTAALPDDHAELVFARENGIRTSKRDELLAEIIQEKNLKLIAVSGTHGKTTTTGMLIWAFKQLQLPLSYSVGTTLSFGPSGQYDAKSQYFVYECDEFDKNMLHFTPSLTLITSLDHDHFDTYPTIDDYRQAFVQFLEQSDYSLLWGRDLRYLQVDPQADLEAYDEHMDLRHIKLAGDHTRHNAFLVQKALERLLVTPAETLETLSSKDSVFPPAARQDQKQLASSRSLDGNGIELSGIIKALNNFPGTQRRFEKLADNLYTDYGHHPAEIAATLQMARELSDHVVLVYQPHQNIRQHQIQADYTEEVFQNASEVYWLPTYLSRENPDLETLTPQQLTENLTTRDAIHYADLNEELWNEIRNHLSQNHLVLAMGAGSIDGWLRNNLS